jgi:sigma-B regulation protein RsbU (phosphoserine phosphatase)
MDRVLRSSVSGRQFATLLLGCLDEASGKLVFANAGHPFPLLAEPGHGAREVEVPGLPLGQGPPRRYRDHEIALAHGGVLLLHSDGLFEALDGGGLPYGFDRPRHVLGEAAQWNAAEILERVLYDWRRHLGGAPPPDDTTLVVLKRA